MRTFRTDFDAFLAQDALVREELHFLPRGVGLGVMAPQATQVATLKKHAGADAGSIMNGEALDIEDATLHDLSCWFLRNYAKLYELPENYLIYYNE